MQILIYENALLLNIIAGKDPKDLTSATKEVEDFTRLIGQSIQGMKIAVPAYFMSDIVAKNVKEKIASYGGIQINEFSIAYK